MKYVKQGDLQIFQPRQVSKCTSFNNPQTVDILQGTTGMTMSKHILVITMFLSVTVNKQEKPIHASATLKVED